MERLYDIVMTEDGEILSQKLRTVDESGIKRKDKEDLLKDMIDNYLGEFYFFFFDKMTELKDNKNINNSIKCRFLYLCAFADYKDRGSNLIHTDNFTTGRKIALTKEEIKQELRLSAREFSNTMKVLKENNLLYENDNGVYYIPNDDYVVRGKINNKQKDTSYTRVFFDGIKSLYRKSTPRQHKTLYYLFMMLPYINTYYNCLCTIDTVDEEIEENIKVLDMKDVCDIVGYNRHDFTKLKKILFDLNIDSNDLMIIVSSKNKHFIKINPKLYYKGCKPTYLQALISDFKLVGKRDIDLS